MATGSKKVLIAEDEDDIRELLRDRVRFYGFKVQTATDGENCWELLQSWNPDLLILDLRMPLLSGERVMDRLKAQNSSIPVIVISASADRQMAEKLIASQEIEYLLKPFEPRDLESKLFQFFERPSMTP